MFRSFLPLVFIKFVRIVFYFSLFWTVASLNVLFVNVFDIEINVVRNTQREKAPSNKTQALTKSTNMGVWVFGTSN